MQSQKCAKYLSLPAALICVWGISQPPVMSAESRGLVGTLTCTVSDGTSFVFGRTRDLSCIFDPIGEGVNHSYKGSISKYGLNVGAAKGRVVMVWNVLSSIRKLGPSSLAGTYTGFAAGVVDNSVAGEDGLVGGPNNAMKLIPLQTQPNADVNFAIAIAKMILRPVRRQA